MHERQRRTGLAGDPRGTPGRMPRRSRQVDADIVEQYRRRTRAEATRQLHALAERSGLEPGGWEPCVIEGDPSQRLVEQEQVHDCDLVILVILGKHGRSATEDLLLGSVTKHVLAEGSADVLVSTRHEA